MKRLIAAAVLALLTAGICFAGSRTVRRVCVGTQEILASGSDAEAAASAAEYWRSNRVRMSVFVGHDALDEVDLLLTELTVAAQPGEGERIRAMLTRKTEEIIAGQRFDPGDFL